MRLSVDIAENYNKYYAGRLYHRRYPHPNPLGLAAIVSEIRTRRAKVLDFGCGNGRYTLPLLERTDATIVAYDISQVALEQLSRQCAIHIEADRLHPVTGDLASLIDAVGQDRQFDLVIMMFGVLGHIPSRALRRETLESIRGLLRPDGRLIVSVPNAARRFCKEQTAAQRLIQQGHLEPGDILYERKSGDVTVSLYYHLYTLEEFVRELRQAGFRALAIYAESFLPETSVVRSTLLRWLDRLMMAVVPLRYAYGLLAVAEVIAGSDREGCRCAPRSGGSPQ